MPVGSTNTIIYLMYKENNIKIPKDMAGLMLSGILSDTLILNSPTTTNIDKDAVNNLSRIAKVDYKKYGFDIEFDNIEKITERFKDMEKKDVVNELTSMKESVKELNKQISDYVQENIKQKNKEQER